MSRTWIKICGIKTPEMALVAADAGADAIGLVFVEKSPRYVTMNEAGAVIAAVPPSVEPIGLFVDAPIDDIRRTAVQLGLRTIQLHGSETPQYVRDLAPLRVIKAFGFDTNTIDAVLRPWRDARVDNLEAILIDTPAADADAKKQLTGGSGRAIDWSAVAEAKKRRAFDGLPPLILAGGLTSEGVDSAIRTVRPYGVDVSSGVESSRGVKDAGLVRACCEAVRRASDG